MGAYTDYLRSHKNEVLSRLNAQAEKGEIPLCRVVQLIKEWFSLAAWRQVDMHHPNLLPSVADYLNCFMPIQFGYDRSRMQFEKMDVLRRRGYPNIAELLESLHREVDKIHFENYDHEAHRRFLEALLTLHPFSARFYRRMQNRLPAW